MLRINYNFPFILAPHNCQLAKTLRLHALILFSFYFFRISIWKSQALCTSFSHSIFIMITLCGWCVRCWRMPRPRWLGYDDDTFFGSQRYAMPYHVPWYAFEWSSDSLCFSVITIIRTHCQLCMRTERRPKKNLNLKLEREKTA